jgi:hypothetical protein
MEFLSMNGMTWKRRAVSDERKPGRLTDRLKNKNASKRLKIFFLFEAKYLYLQRLTLISKSA